jgi:ankyrin repeat protein
MQILTREREKEEERQRKEDLCLNAIFIVAQFGDDTKIEGKKCVYASDIKNVATLCHATWEEEMLWAGLVRAQTGKLKKTSLMYAAGMNDLARVSWLLKRADPKVLVRMKTTRGDTAFDYAIMNNRIRSNQLEIIEIFLKFVEIDENLLSKIVKLQDIEIMKLFVEADTKLIFRSYNVLYEAIISENYDLVQAMIQMGANLNANCLLNFRGSFKRTPLMIAASKQSPKHFRILKLLIDSGADVNAPSEDGEGSALLWACENSTLNSVKLLVSSGADINAVCDEGESCLHRCARNRKLAKYIAPYLLSKGANIHATDLKGRTVLDTAGRKGTFFHFPMEYIMSDLRAMDPADINPEIKLELDRADSLGIQPDFSKFM